MFISSYIEQSGLPGSEWVFCFLKRQSLILNNKHCENISHKCAAINKKIATIFFTDLAKSIKDVPNANIIHYDEKVLLMIRVQRAPAIVFANIFHNIRISFFMIFNCT